MPDGDRSHSLTVGVVGAGTMGAGIAQVCLQAGHEVVLYDVDEAARCSRTHAHCRRAGPTGRRRPTGGRRARRPALDRLRQAYTLEAVAGGADVVIEAALEDLGLKQAIFRALGAEAPAGTHPGFQHERPVGDAICGEASGGRPKRSACTSSTRRR